MISSRLAKGLNDFLVQRLTAVLLGLYALCVIGFFLMNPDLDYVELVSYFRSLPMQLFSTVALLSLWAHGSIGLLTVGRDYIRPQAVGRSAVSMALIYDIGVQVVLTAYLVWGLTVIWGIL